MKFAPDRSFVTISLGRASPHELRVVIEDEGPGIAPGEHLRIFDRFFIGSSRQADQTPSAGLGLSIAKLIVERSGGTIGFEHRTGSGACCVIALPCTTVD